MNTPVGQLGQDLVQLPIAHQRLAAHDGDVHRLVLVDQAHELGDQLRPLEVVELAQGGAGAEVIVGERVAAGAGEGTLACDFNRKTRCAAGENPPPCRE